MYQRQATFSEAVTSAIKEHYCDFNGRASRSQFWWYVLFTGIIGCIFEILMCIFAFMGMDTLPKIIYGINVLVGLALLLPSWGVAVRRLHDTNRSGWWALLYFVPIVGWIFLIIWFCQDSQMTPNQYGEVPYLTE